MFSIVLPPLVPLISVIQYVHTLPLFPLSVTAYDVNEIQWTFCLRYNL